MDDATAQKMLASGNQVSVYYQGDDDSKKGWKKIEPVRIEGEGDDKVMVAYEIEGLGKKPVLKKYVQKKITKRRHQKNLELSHQLHRKET